MPMRISSPEKLKRTTISFQGKQASQNRIHGGGSDTGAGTGAGGAGPDDFEAWLKSRALVKPDDQLDLTEAELNEEITKVLTNENTNVVKNLVIYSFKDGAFVPIPPDSNIVTLFQFEGTALHKESEEAQRQVLEYGEEGQPLDVDKPRDYPDKADNARKFDYDEDEGEGGAAEGIEGEQEGGEEEFLEGGEEGEYEGEGDMEVEAQQGEEEHADAGEQVEAEHEEGEEGVVGRLAIPVQPTGRKRKLINQFNFCERAALTYNNPSRTVETQTIPPPRSKFGGNVLQWVIYDSYTEDFAQQQKEKEKEKRPGLYKKESSLRKVDKSQLAEELNKKYLQCWQILERMINQNIFDDIAQDYRYWEDPSDEFREQEGTLLPLWKFSYEKTKKMTVTDVCFNSLYYDLIVACYGSFDFMKQPPEGGVCLYTIKNPSFPDYRITCESGVMCCSVHPKYSFLLVIGLYDGNVCVYNLQTSTKTPIYMSQGYNSKHSEAVWDVKWGPDMPDGEINFYSLGGDGKVFNWVLMQNKLCLTTIITLYLEKPPIRGPDGVDIRLKAFGTCMIFHPTNPEIFLVGSEEGLIYKCSTAYSSKYLMTYHAHYLSVYTIDFNKFNHNIFASCSGDWRVKIWEDMREDPLFIFDLGSCVGDVKWAPYSSTVLAAVTTDGKVFVFDLNVNKYKPICVQPVVSKRRHRLTRLSFNTKLPFIVVGDDKGTVTSLKLSPNLRLQVKPPKKQQNLDQLTLQIQKLDKLLSLVRELPEGAEEKEVATTEQS